MCLDVNGKEDVVHVSRMSPFFAECGLPDRQYDRYVTRSQTHHTENDTNERVSPVHAPADVPVSDVRDDGIAPAEVDRSTRRPATRSSRADASPTTLAATTPTQPTPPRPERRSTSQAQEEFEVEALLDREVRRTGSRTQPKTVWYKVRWTGYDRAHDSWEPESELTRHCQPLITAYNTAHPAR